MHCLPALKLRAALAAVALMAPSVAAAQAPPAGAAGLEIRGMTFVQSRGDAAEMVVEAEQGRIEPDTKMVHLETVRTVVETTAERAGFEMTCDRGELALEDHALYASGNVRGRTADGRSFATSWVRYDPEKELAYTDAPVEIEDASGRLAGGGFRYHVKEGRFKLLRGATVRRESGS